MPTDSWERFSFHVPTKVVYGAGMLDRVYDLTCHLGERPLIVTGQGSSRANGALNRCTTWLGRAKVFAGVEENPTDVACDEAAKICREKKCDYIVALGGGSVIDQAKAIAVLVTNKGRAQKFYGANQYTHSPLPIVAIPTTAGTGSETTPYSVLVDVDANDKRTISGTELFPRVAILDPQLSVSMPRSVTIHSGLDALSQGIEGILSSRATPTSDVLALETIRLVVEWLPRATEQPDDVEARGRMLYAAMLSGMVVAQTGTTLVHGMGYLYTTECGVAHGLANALLLPPLMTFNAGVVPERLEKIAGALGVDANAGTAGKAGAAAIRALVEGLGLSSAARDHGVPEDCLNDFTARICANPTRFRHEVGDLGRDDIEGFYEQSWRGE